MKLTFLKRSSLGIWFHYLAVDTRTCEMYTYVIMWRIELK